MRDTGGRRRRNADPPLIVIRVDHALTSDPSALLKRIIEFLLLQRACSDDFATWGEDPTREVTISSSTDGRALELAGLFCQRLEQEHIPYDFDHSEDLNPIPNLREVIAGDLSGSNNVRAWTTLGPLTPMHAGSISFERIAHLLREHLTDLQDHGNPIVIFTHEGFGPIIAYLASGTRLRELPPDPPPGKVMCILGNGVLNIPASPTYER